MLLALVGISSKRWKTLIWNHIVLYSLWTVAIALYQGLPQSGIEFPLLGGALKSTFLFCTFGGWLIGLWSPTLFSLWNHTNSILHYFQPSCFSHLSLLLFVWKFSGLWLACLCIGSCLSWWRTPGNRCHWPGLSRFVGSGYALVGCLWAADSFPHFLVLVGSSYVGSILNGTKL